MSSNIDPNVNRSSFFPKSRSQSSGKTYSPDEPILPKRNDIERINKLKDSTKLDANVEIDEATKDFARIKSAVDLAPLPDNSEKIKNLKSKIEMGEYEIDYDALAEKLLTSEL